MYIWFHIITNTSTLKKHIIFTSKHNYVYRACHVYNLLKKISTIYIVYLLDLININRIFKQTYLPLRVSSWSMGNIARFLILSAADIDFSHVYTLLIHTYHIKSTAYGLFVSNFKGAIGTWDTCSGIQAQFINMVFKFLVSLSLARCMYCCWLAAIFDIYFRSREDLDWMDWQQRFCGSSYPKVIMLGKPINHKKNA